MGRACLLFICVIFALGACTQRMICPAYQSAYIYDKDELRKKFSYMLEDSTPKILTASKNKYLIAVPTSYREKMRNMATVEMKPVQPVVPDSLRMDGEIDPEEFAMAERSIIDSTYIVDVPQGDEVEVGDSVYVITKDRETRILKYNMPDSLKFDEATGKFVPETPSYSVVHVGFNTEQDNYMWYMRKLLVLPDVKLAQQGDKEEAKAAKKKKGFFSFLKRKDKKTEEENASLLPDTTASQKKGFFSFLKKKDKEPKEDTPKEEKPPKEKKKKKKEEAKEEEEEEDDGF